MKSLRNGMCLFMAIVALFIFAACGSNSKPDGTRSGKPGETQADTADKTQPDTASNAQNEQAGKGVSIPEGYPTEFVPIMEDAVTGWGMGSDGNFELSYTTPASAENVLKYYTGKFEKYGDSVKISDNQKEINLEAEGKTVHILIDAAGDATSLRISISSESEAENNDIAKDDEGSSDNAVGEQEAFPTNIVPIIDGAEITDNTSEKTEAGTEYSANLQVKKSLKDVAAFYKNVINEMSNGNIQDGDSEFYATAEKSSNKVEIQIIENSGDSAECMVVINIYPN